MSEVTGRSFDQGMGAWQAWQAAPWGRLRYRVAAANLARHLGERPLHILDLGGGNGYDAVLLAKQGHTVTVLDFSAEMMVNGRQLAESEGVSITFQEGDVRQLANYFAAEAFDLVLCHNVLQYVGKAITAVMQASHHILKPSGLLSLIISNPHSEVFAQALREHDLAATLATLDNPTHYVATFAATIQRYTDKELIGMLQTAEFNLLHQYGIRALCDFIADNDRKYDPDFYQQLEALELALSDREPYKYLARFYHFIAKKQQSALNTDY
jgi:S-adenosylmethionine-dependent methyltransferase